MKIDVPSTRPLIDKLGVKQDLIVSLVNLTAPGFIELLETRTPHYTIDKPRKESDLIFLGADSPSGLKHIARMIPFIKQNGAMWIIYPKGIKTITEANVREAGLAAGLVDNKVVSFSATHTALRFAIRLLDRKKPT
jgi:hypothetical protein